jgi:flagella basal body P-ring formation protein FlgA
MLLGLIRKMEWVLPVALIALGSALHPPAQAMDATQDHDSESDPQAQLIDKLSQSISARYPGAKVSVGARINWSHRSSGEKIQGVSLLGETSRGEMMFAVTGADGRRDGDGWVEFSAWTTARVAVKRLHPGDRLSAEMFSLQEINVAAGQPHELRGVILEADAPVNGLEARQSVLEGQLLLSSSVQRIPDVRRGDMVSVHLVSNGLSLQTQGTATEPAYSGGPVRVSVSKTKREIVGKLGTNGVVEVKL